MGSARARSNRVAVVFALRSSKSRIHRKGPVRVITARLAQSAERQTLNGTFTLSDCEWYLYGEVTANGILYGEVTVNGLL